jgi:NAD(P)-dependent dehydrogenase (short-subunit alcohol dehydrogenase family)
MGRLDGKTAAVTGGASGIGEGIVRALAAEGAAVMVADIDDERGCALAADALGRVAYHRTDVTQESAIVDLVARTRSEFGGFDILCNNAGALVPRGSILQISTAQFDHAIALLLRSVFYGLKHGGAVMAEQGHGPIINTASTAGLLPGGGPHIYAAAKAAVIHLTKSASLELGEKGVRVNCVCPGGVVTKLTLDAVGVDDSAAESLHEAMGTMRPLGRATTPGDVGRMVAFLASDESRNITGQAVTVDAGESTGVLWSKQAVR